MSIIYSMNLQQQVPSRESSVSWCIMLGSEHFPFFHGALLMPAGTLKYCSWSKWIASFVITHLYILRVVIICGNSSLHILQKHYYYFLLTEKHIGDLYFAQGSGSSSKMVMMRTQMCYIMYEIQNRLLP